MYCKHDKSLDSIIQTTKLQMIFIGSISCMDQNKLTFHTSHVFFYFLLSVSNLVGGIFIIHHVK